MSGLSKVSSVGTVIGAGMAALGKTMKVGSDGKSWSPVNAALRHPGGDEQTPRDAPYEAKTIDSKFWAGAATRKHPG